MTKPETLPATQAAQEIIAAAPAPQPETPQSTTLAMIGMIKEVATSPNVNVGAIQAMLDMQRQLVKDQAERNFNIAMAEMSAELPRVKKRGKVEYLVDPKGPKDGPKQEAFKHAKWEDIDTALRPLLVKHGFSLSFTTEPRAGDGGGLTMVGRLSHREGHFIESRLAVALDSSGGKNNIQGMGSSSSYGKRYVTCNLLNIITEGEDDDGNKAELITTEQAAEIDLMLREIKVDRSRFLKWIGAEEVQAISMTKFGKAIAELQKRKAAVKPQQTKGAA